MTESQEPLAAALRRIDIRMPVPCRLRWHFKRAISTINAGQGGQDSKKAPIKKCLACDNAAQSQEVWARSDKNVLHPPIETLLWPRWLPRPMARRVGGPMATAKQTGRAPIEICLQLSAGGCFGGRPPLFLLCLLVDDGSANRSLRPIVMVR